MQRIIFTVTNDLNYDQRMQRICTSLSKAGYDIHLVGRKMKNSLPLEKQSFTQKRLHCFFQTGILFYAEFNIRLFFWLLFKKTDAVCAIDLDTILPVYYVTALRGKKRIYDAHELFTEQKEIITRPAVHRAWLAIERFAVPRFRNGYTVNEFIIQELYNRYKVQYGLVRNLPQYAELPIEKLDHNKEKFLIYQGAVNEGRGFETLIPAMKQVNCMLRIFGQGNFFEQVKELISTHHLEEKVILEGPVFPAALKKITPQAFLGIMLFENAGMNQYQSLSNRFFDYIMAGIPQLCVAYPEYKRINDQYNIAYMIEDTRIESIANALNAILSDDEEYVAMKKSCMIARTVLNWQKEEKKLEELYIQFLKD
ncbi:MAG: glycosyltransferase [Chitinophagaceae bacterium]